MLLDDAHLLDRPSAEALVFAARRLVSDPVAMLVVARVRRARDARPGAALPTLTLAGLDLDGRRASWCRHAPGRVRREPARPAAPGDRQATRWPCSSSATGADRLDGGPAGDARCTVSEQLSRSFIGRVEDLDRRRPRCPLVAAADSAGAGHRARRPAGGSGLDRCRGWPRPRTPAWSPVRDGRVAFRHPLVRSAVYGAADPATRREVHRALAAVVPPDRDRPAGLAPRRGRGRARRGDRHDPRRRRPARPSARGAHAIAASAHERAAELTAGPGAAAGRLADGGEAAWLAGRDRPGRRAARPGAGQRPRARRCGRTSRGCAARSQTRCGSLDEAAGHAAWRPPTPSSRRTPTPAVRLLADAIHASLLPRRLRGRACAPRRRIDALLDALRATPGPTRWLDGVAAWP